MTHLLYSPALEPGWFAVASAGQLLVVKSDESREVNTAAMSALWGRVDAGPQATLDVLTREGISVTPPFALLQWSGDLSLGAALRVIVRGDVRVTIESLDEQTILDGAGVSTWTEQSVAGATAFDVSVESSAGQAQLPLAAGVVPVERIRSSVPPKPTVVSEQTVPSEQTVAPKPTEAPKPTVAPRQTVAPKPTVEPAAAEVTMVDRPVAKSAATTSATNEGEGGGHDPAVEVTMYRAVSDPAGADPAGADPVGDHDGMTIMNDDLRKLRKNRKSEPATAAPLTPPAPRLFLQLSTGAREVLTQPVLVGRAPTVNKVSGGEFPRLVTIPGDKDISRNHAQFVVEGGTVVVTDLHSRNGTQIVLPGKAPQQLRQGEPTAVIVGTVIDLGGGVTLTVGEES